MSQALHRHSGTKHFPNTFADPFGDSQVTVIAIDKAPLTDGKAKTLCPFAFAFSHYLVDS